MKQVKDYNEFFRQLSKFKKENAPTYTNFYIFGSKLKNIIAQGRLYADIVDDSIIVYENEGEYFQFYYCIRSEADFSQRIIDKTCASWLIYNDKTSREDIQAQRDKLLQAGFKHVVNNIQYVMNIQKHSDIIKQNLAPLLKRAEKNGIVLRFMEPKDYKEVDALWRQCFDDFRIPDISRELPELSADRRIILACQKENVASEELKMKIIGCQFMDFQGKTVHTHKTCVDSECRGLSIGKLLVLVGLNEALKRGCSRWLVEVDEGNIASEQMHLGAIGERPKKNGVISELFVRNSPAS